MKKVLGILIITVFSTFNTNAEIISVGINGNVGVLDATGKETFNSKTSTRSEELAMAYISGFAELHVPLNIGPGQFRVGASYVPYSLESQTTASLQRSLNQAQGGTGEANRTQKIQVDIEELLSYYLSYHYNGFFIKAGVLEADLITNEKLDSGSVYPNANLNGSFAGIGFDKNLDVLDGIFVRGEVSQTDFDSFKLTSTGSDNTNVVDITGLSGTNVSISVGKSF
jgi:hypothetical protein